MRKSFFKQQVTVMRNEVLHMNKQMLREIQKDLEIRRNAIKETYTENNFHEIQKLIDDLDEAINQLERIIHDGGVS